MSYVVKSRCYLILSKEICGSIYSLTVMILHLLRHHLILLISEVLALIACDLIHIISISAYRRCTLVAHDNKAVLRKSIICILFDKGGILNGVYLSYLDL